MPSCLVPGPSWVGQCRAIILSLCNCLFLVCIPSCTDGMSFVFCISSHVIRLRENNDILT